MAQVGAHVYVKRLHQIFILPTCQECNRDPEQEYDGTKDCWICTNNTAVVVRVKRHQNTYEPEPNLLASGDIEKKCKKKTASRQKTEGFSWIPFPGGDYNFSG